MCSEVCFSSQGNYFCYFSCLWPSLDGLLSLAFNVKNEEFEICMCLYNTIFICKLLSHDKDSLRWELWTHTHSAFDLAFPQVDILENVNLFLQLYVKIVAHIFWVFTLATHCFKQYVSWILTTFFDKYGYAPYLWMRKQNPEKLSDFLRVTQPWRSNTQIRT